MDPHNIPEIGPLRWSTVWAALRQAFLRFFCLTKPERPAHLAAGEFWCWCPEHEIGLLVEEDKHRTAASQAARIIAGKLPNVPRRLVVTVEGSDDKPLHFSAMPVNSGQFADATDIPVVFWHATRLRRMVPFGWTGKATDNHPGRRTDHQP